MLSATPLISVLSQVVCQFTDSLSYFFRSRGGEAEDEDPQQRHYSSSPSSVPPGSSSVLSFS